MATASRAASNFANQRGAETCTESAVSCIISEVIRAKYPSKTWAFIAQSLGLQERAAKHRLAGSRPYTVAELQTLLQSEDGLDILVALMADAEPKWWWWAKQVMAVASIKRRRAEDEQEILRLETSAPAEIGARRRIKGALNANQSVNAALDRAETALGFRRPDATGALAAAPRAGAGLSHRAVAARAKR